MFVSRMDHSWIEGPTSKGRGKGEGREGSYVGPSQCWKQIDATPIT